MDCIEEGFVARLVDARQAIVTATRSEACSTCSSRGMCTSLGGEVTTTEVQAINDIGARPGDRVSVGLAGSSIVRAAGLLYFFPAIALIGGALIGQQISAGRGANPDAGAALGAACALGLSLVLVALVGRKLARRREFIPRITAILVPGSHPDVGA
jgi:sigma-E factor negative regulatory protein RseC